MGNVIKRHVEKAAEATMNIGDHQFLKIKSLVSQEIEGDEESIKAEEAKMWKELTLDLRRGMWGLLKGLGKTTDADKRMFEACAQRVQEATAVKPQVQEKAQESTVENTQEVAKE